jgi:hypothetical protein
MNESSPANRDPVPSSVGRGQSYQSTLLRQLQALVEDPVVEAMYRLVFPQLESITGTAQTAYEVYRALQLLARGEEGVTFRESPTLGKLMALDRFTWSWTTAVPGFGSIPWICLAIVLKRSKYYVWGLYCFIYPFAFLIATHIVKHVISSPHRSWLADAIELLVFVALWGIGVVNAQREWRRVERLMVEYNRVQHAANVQRHTGRIFARISSGELRSIDNRMARACAALFQPTNRVYLAPDIPAEKLAAAERRFLFLLPDEELLLLCDESLFGTCSEGFALTTRRVYWRNDGKRPVVAARSFAELESPVLERILLNHRVVIGKKEAINVTLNVHDVGIAFAEFLTIASREYHRYTS